MKYKFITIEDDGFTEHRRAAYTVRNLKSGDALGTIMWYPAWRCWVFTQESFCVFNKSCLLDIIDFMDNHAGKE